MARKQYLSNEVIHRNKEGILVSNQVVRISLNKAIIIFATAVIGSAGASFWGGLRIANALPFRVDAMENQIISIKNTVEANNTKFMPLDLSIEKWKNNDIYHAQIEKKLDIIETKIDTIRNLIK